MKPYRVILDTNILVSGLKSTEGASFKLLTLLGSEQIQISISVPLLLEYEDVLKRERIELNYTAEEVNDFLDYICTISDKRKIFYLWRPFLKDLKDDLVLEVAVASQSKYIITSNKRDFTGVEQFGLKALTPKIFLEKLGEI